MKRKHFWHVPPTDVRQQRNELVLGRPMVESYTRVVHVWTDRYVVDLRVLSKIKLIQEVFPRRCMSSHSYSEEVNTLQNRARGLYYWFVARTKGWLLISSNFSREIRDFLFQENDRVVFHLKLIKQHFNSKRLCCSNRFPASHRCLVFFLVLIFIFKKRAYITAIIWSVPSNASVPRRALWEHIYGFLDALFADTRVTSSLSTRGEEYEMIGSDQLSFISPSETWALFDQRTYSLV